MILQNTTRSGDEFERRIFDLLQTEINSDRFPFKKDCCRIFSKKGYYSRDRCSEIIFDIAIEVHFPGVQECSVRLIVECKHYSHAVPVDDIEEFFTKVQQVGASNTKAIVISTASFQKGAFEFAKSKGMGLARYFSPENLKWELRRSPSTIFQRNVQSIENSERSLWDENFTCSFFDIYFQFSNQTTNSLWEFSENILSDVSSAVARKFKNSRKQSEEVTFIGKEQIEEISSSILSKISYKDGEVNLQKICEIESNKSGLQLRLNCSTSHLGINNKALGRITFNPPIIEIFEQFEANSGRERFTLAHEMAHFFLDRGRYLASESCDDEDFSLHRGNLDNAAISRLEFQANYMAACMILPRAQVVDDFYRLLKIIGVLNKGFGSLYVDDQLCNIQNYDFVTVHLMEKYGTSRSAVRIRLKTLNLLKDDRRQSSIGNVFSFL